MENLVVEVSWLELFRIKVHLALKILEPIVSSCSTAWWCLEAGELISLPVDFVTCSSII